MSLYGEDREEAVFQIRRAGAWRRAGFISEGERAAVEALLDPGLRRTGVFFRLLLLVFTALCLGAAFGLVCWSFSIDGRVSLGAAALLFAVLSQAVAEREARVHGLYRHGVEEALALAAAGFAVAALYSLVLEPALSGRMEAAAFWLSAAAAGFWLRFRFGFLYGALIALAALAAVPFTLDLGEAELRTALSALFAAAFFISVWLERPEDGDGRREARAFMQAVSILGLYLSLNVRLPSLGRLVPWLWGIQRQGADVPPSFYWTTYVLVFAVPAGLLAAGLRLRRRVFLDAGLITLILSLCTNKDYWGWTHRAWDPAVLGTLMAAAAWEADRWFKGRRAGVTSDDVWKPRRHGLELAALGAAVLAPAPAAAGEGTAGFGGGASGGGGAQGNF